MMFFNPNEFPDEFCYGAPCTDCTGVTERSDVKVKILVEECYQSLDCHKDKCSSSVAFLECVQMQKRCPSAITFLKINFSVLP